MDLTTGKFAIYEAGAKDMIPANNLLASSFRVIAYMYDKVVPIE